MASGSGPRGVFFDLDRTLIDSRRAWEYTVEEAVVTITGERPAVAQLAEEYHARPWSHALRIVVPDARQAERCAELCERLSGRSAMKRLLVFEGVGMALDGLRMERVEVGVISRAAHAIALKQMQSTGLDRFATVLAPTPPGERWSPAERLSECARYLERAPEEYAFVGREAADLREAEAARFRGFAAAWAGPAEGNFPAIELPAAILASVRRTWAAN